MPEQEEELTKWNACLTNLKSQALLMKAITIPDKYWTVVTQVFVSWTALV
jgi:hypothetical protein